MLAERGPDLSFAYVKFLMKVEKQFAFCFDVQMRSYDGYIMGKKEVSHEPLMFHIDLDSISQLFPHHFILFMSPSSQVWFDSWVQLLDPVALI